MTFGRFEWGEVMALYQRGKKGIWWYEFEVHGRRYRESTKTTSERLAEKIERKRHHELEAAHSGIDISRRSVRCSSQWPQPNGST